jgi:hypothetical protein
VRHPHGHQLPFRSQLARVHLPLRMAGEPAADAQLGTLRTGVDAPRRTEPGAASTRRRLPALRRHPWPARRSDRRNATGIPNPLDPCTPHRPTRLLLPAMRPPRTRPSTRPCPPTSLRCCTVP